MAEYKPGKSLKSGAACLFLILFVLPVWAKAGEALSSFARLSRAGLIVSDADGRIILAENADTPLMPASTTKLATAWLALNHWSGNHRFRTEFFLDETTQTLWVKGSGDPYLVSEEINIIARNLALRGLNQVKTIGLDNSLFEPDLILPGTGTSNNPYDAVPTALAANFNTVAVKKSGGQFISADAVTPLTPYSEQLARSNRSGEIRVNTGPNPKNAEIYFGELLAAFLRKNGVPTGTRIIHGQAPAKAAFYLHENSLPLNEILRSMLKYSTNFIANQLILMLSAEHFKRPANPADVQSYMEGNLSRHFGWKNFSMADGAGLSRTNRLSPRQLTQLLQAFQNWKQLLPEVEPGIYAKSGTLTGVSALAGFLANENGQRRFAIIMNEDVPHHLKNRIARELLFSK